MAVKAGPKRRRARAEEELIREAVEEHGRRGKVQSGRKASKVRTYSYKDEADKRKRAKQFVTEQDRMYAMREPDGPDPFEQFVLDLPDDARPFAKTYWHMQCEHKYERDVEVNPSYVNGVEPVFRECIDCGLVRRWHGGRNETKRQEWVTYCPDGFDMFEWADLFTRNRSLWRFIHDEAIAEMTDELTEEVAA